MIPPVCVCVPARNESDRIATLFGALAEQEVAEPFVVALCVNNSTDETLQIAQQAAYQANGRFELRWIERQFPSKLAHAGSARRAAMNFGAKLIGQSEGLLISTDADCRPPKNWVAANAEAAAPHYIVGGRIELDEEERIKTPYIFAVRKRLDAYWHQVRAIEDSVDPSPWDLPPRHGDHSGASLALSVSLYRKTGGVPLLASGEDQALVRAAIMQGGKLVHPQAVWTRASPRVVGRAKGGMAGDIKRWVEAGAQGYPIRVPHYRHWQKRASWRRALRVAQGAEILCLTEQQLPPMPCDMDLPEELQP